MDSTHFEYDANANACLRARDVFAGEDAVKAAGVRYLPRLDSQSDDEYDAYKERASFFNAMARTADGFVGLVCDVCRLSNCRTRPPRSAWHWPSFGMTRICSALRCSVMPRVS